LESAIRAAGHYVQPSFDLRPRTLETIRTHRARQRRHIQVASICLAIVVLLTLPGTRREQHPSKLAVTNTAEIHLRAYQMASVAGVGPTWALVEAFLEVRADQIERLHAEREGR
jgi:hypothetical protein